MNALGITFQFPVPTWTTTNTGLPVGITFGSSIFYNPAGFEYEDSYQAPKGTFEQGTISMSFGEFDFAAEQDVFSLSSGDIYEVDISLTVSEVVGRISNPLFVTAELLAQAGKVLASQMAETDVLQSAVVFVDELISSISPTGLSIDTFYDMGLSGVSNDSPENGTVVGNKKALQIWDSMGKEERQIILDGNGIKAEDEEFRSNLTIQEIVQLAAVGFINAGDSLITIIKADKDIKKLEKEIKAGTSNFSDPKKASKALKLLKNIRDKKFNQMKPMIKAGVTTAVGILHAFSAEKSADLLLVEFNKTYPGVLEAFLEKIKSKEFSKTFPGLAEKVLEIWWQKAGVELPHSDFLAGYINYLSEIISDLEIMAGNYQQLLSDVPDEKKINVFMSELDLKIAEMKMQSVYYMELFQHHVNQKLKLEFELEKKTTLVEKLGGLIKSTQKYMMPIGVPALTGSGGIGYIIDTVLSSGNKSAKVGTGGKKVGNPVNFPHHKSQLDYIKLLTSRIFELEQLLVGLEDMYSNLPSLEAFNEMWKTKQGELAERMWKVYNYKVKLELIKNEIKMLKFKIENQKGIIDDLKSHTSDDKPKKFVFTPSKDGRYGKGLEMGLVGLLTFKGSFANPISPERPFTLNSAVIDSEALILDMLASIPAFSSMIEMKDSIAEIMEGAFKINSDVRGIGAKKDFEDIAFTFIAQNALPSLMRKKMGIGQEAGSLNGNNLVYAFMLAAPILFKEQIIVSDIALKITDVWSKSLGKKELPSMPSKDGISEEMDYQNSSYNFFSKEMENPFWKIFSTVVTEKPEIILPYLKKFTDILANVLTVRMFYPRLPKEVRDKIDEDILDVHLKEFIKKHILK